METCLVCRAVLSAVNFAALSVPPSAPLVRQLGYLKPYASMKTLTLASLVWFTLMLGVFIFSPPLNEAFFMLFPFASWALVGVGVVLLSCAAVLFVRKRRGTIAMAACLIGLIGYYTVGFDLGRHVLFQIRRPHYEALLQHAKQTGSLPKGSGHVDLSSPAKFAFYWQRGVVDNWAGVVFDPTGDIARINIATNFDELYNPAVSDLVGIFGGTYYHWQDMGDGWYICWFT